MKMQILRHIPAAAMNTPSRLGKVNNTSLWCKVKFTNRQQAGQELAEKVADFLSQRPELDTSSLVVAGLPRGGVPVALEIAHRLSLPVDLIVSKKIPYPGQPECAIGAVSSQGLAVLNQSIPPGRDWQAYIEQQERILLQRTRSAEAAYYQQAGRAPSIFKGKTVIVVDDGIATGMTAIAAVETARQLGAHKVIVAAPVMSRESYRQLAPSCDHIIALSLPESFHSVGLHYQDFSPTSEDEVVAALRDSVALPIAGRKSPERTRHTGNQFSGPGSR